MYYISVAKYNKKKKVITEKVIKHFDSFRAASKYFRSNEQRPIYLWQIVPKGLNPEMKPIIMESEAYRKEYDKMRGL